MIEGIELFNVQAAAGGVQQGPASLPAASVHDVAQFYQAWEKGRAAEAASVAAPAAAASSGQSEGVRNMLAALDSLNGRASIIGDQSKEFALGGAEMTPSDMLNLTVRCHEFLFHCELTSNVANRSSDGIQQLFRQQS
jgi:hypothetical protein